MVIGCAVGLGIALRAWTLATSIGHLESDEAVWGLMARHMLQGEFTPFFWDQTYGGTQETILTAAVFKVAGSSIAALRVVPLALYGLAAWLLWRIALRTVGDRGAVIATSLFLITPAWFIYKTTRAHGFYAFTMVASLGIILTVLRLRDRPNWPEAGWLGLLLGLGWWASAQAVLIAGPALIWLVARKPSILKKAPLIVATACIGAFPWIVDNLRHDWHSLDPESDAPPGSTYGEHLLGFFEHVLPSGLGLRLPFTQDWVITPVISWFLYALLIAGFVWLLITRPKPLELLLVVALCYPFIVAASEFSYYVSEPRYVHLLLPVIALMGGYALARIKPRLIAAVGVGVLLLCVGGLVTMKNDIGAPVDYTSTVKTLKAHGIDRAFAEYLVAYPISFVAREEVIASSTGHVRYPPHDDAVRSHPNPAWVFAEEDSQRDSAFADALEGLGVPYQRVEIEDFVVYFPASAIHPEAVPAAR